MGLAYASKQGYFGLIKEVTYGVTPSSGTPLFFPIEDDVAITLGQKFLANEGLVGSPVATIDQVQGVRSDEYDFKTYIYADTFPLLLVAALGGVDTVTGSGPYTHIIKLLNSPTTGSQSPSFSLMLFDGANFWTSAGGRMGNLEITASSDGTAQVSTKFFLNPSAPTTTAPTVFASPSFSSEVMIPGWSFAANINSTAIPYIETCTLTIERSTAPIFTAGQQAPYDNFQGPAKVTGKMTAVVASQSDPWTVASSGQGLTRDQIPVTLIFTDPNDQTSSTQHSVEFIMSKTQFMNPKRSQGKLYVEVDSDFEAIADSTDATTGVSPMSTTTVNDTSTAYN